MADKGISSREAALIAQARASLLKKPVGEAVPAAAPPVAPAQAQQKEFAPLPAPAEALAPTPEAAPDPAAAERIAAVMAAARAEAERRRVRHKTLYVRLPFAFVALIAVSALLWIWFAL
jgi:hypothetical protein